jgi:primosomal protein N'
MSKEYACPLISCLQTMLPKSLKPKSGKKVGVKLAYFVQFVKYDSNLTSKQQEVLDFVKENKKVLKNNENSVKITIYYSPKKCHNKLVNFSII